MEPVNARRRSNARPRLLPAYSAADRKGRKAALLLIIGLMTASMAMLAFAPTYAAIGVTAPMIIVLARLLQGFAHERGQALAGHLPGPVKPATMSRSAFDEECGSPREFSAFERKASNSAGRSKGEPVKHGASAVAGRDQLADGGIDGRIFSSDPDCSEKSKYQKT